MGPDLARDGVYAGVGEAAADAVVFERSLQKHPFETLSTLVPVGAERAVAGVETDGRDLLAAAGGIVQGEMDRIDADHFAFADELIVNHPEAVAFLECKEVHAPLVDVGQGHDQVGGAAGGDHVVPQRAVDRHIGLAADMLDGFLDLPHVQRVNAAEDRRMDAVFGIDDVTQLAAPLGRGVIVSLHLLAGNQLAHVEGALASLREQVGLGGAETQPVHHAGEGVADADFGGIDFVQLREKTDQRLGKDLHRAHFHLAAGAAGGQCQEENHNCIAC